MKNPPAALPRFIALFMLLVIAGCSRQPSQPEVVLYTSSDSFITAPIVERFQKNTHIRVRIVGDTEATKTTGLIERLFAERASPRADVWWSNEALGTALLAREGLLEPFSPAAAADFPTGWPANFRDPNQLWHGHAVRARIIAYNTNRIKQPPTHLRDLTDARYKGLVGMARPQFGTTRMQMAAIASTAGEAALRDWLKAMRANGLRLYDGNSAVVSALTLGEIEVGLTDTDDAIAASQPDAGKPVAFVYESPDAASAPAGALPSAGPLLIPNTIALIKGGPNPSHARALADYLLSADVELMLAGSESANFPIRAGEKGPSAPKPTGGVSLAPASMAEAVAAADRAVRDALSGL